MSRQLLHSLIGLLAGFFLTGCGDDTPDYRYRLTVEVETPDGLRSGSSVIEVETSVASENAIPSPGLVSHKLRGEAVAVELPDGQVLFALLRSDNDIDWASRVMFMLAPRVRGEDAFKRSFEAMLRDPSQKTLPRMWPAIGHLERRSAYPMLVTFEDMGDPTSVALVEPDDLASSFGAGYALRRITVQLTDDPVTTGIEDRLGWFDRVYDMNLETEDFPEGLPVGDFKGLFSKGFD